ncbi:hypothetical protein Ssi02_58720 [Sinosporangium siamense]|uniref:Uncharacterized protein n=1 Tax=Sinosporangium siamense TaxID=1367973 RepID=A0A919V9S6_9ACTN|nr:hypothetical protein Ssi02_58720 [Sinosporangium siamense]
MDAGLGDDQRVPQRDLRTVGVAQQGPAVSVDALGVAVVKHGEGIRVAGTECSDQNAVIHMTESKRLVTARSTASPGKSSCRNTSGTHIGRGKQVDIATSR